MAPASNPQTPRGKGSSNGVLSVPASAIQKPAATSTPGGTPAKAVAPKLKLVLRRLPPGLTRPEFDTVLGEQWKAGGGVVDYCSFKEGKISKDPAKPSRPARAYFRVASQSQVSVLSDAIRQMSFQDAKNTFRDPVLLGPQSLEYAPHQRLPGSRARKDARQGTIDQDPEFIDFLEGLTNPILKTNGNEDVDGGEKKEEKVTVTPLVQFLKDKKANKAKESASPAKQSKHGRQDSKDTKAEKAQGQNKKLLTRAEKDTPQDKKGAKESKADKAAKEAVKVLSKQAAQANVKPADKTPAAPASKETTPSPAPERKRERGSARGAAAILQRDLGITPPAGRRRQKAAESASPEVSNATQTTSAQTGSPAPEPEKATPTPQPASQVPKSPKASPAKPPNAAPPTGPAAARHAPKQTPAPPSAAPPSKQAKATPLAPPPPASVATQAFLKHANPSQGITEPLLDEAFSAFGKVIKVEIDKRKGFGYVDFEKPESLQKAIQASPVKIAEGQVQVLERKTGASLANRNARGGGNNAAARGGHTPPVQTPTPPPPSTGRSIPQGPAMRPPHGPRGGRGRGGRGMRGGVNTNNSNVRSASPGGNPSAPTPTPTTPSGEAPSS